MRGYKSNFLGIADEIKSNDIVCFCETWLVYEIKVLSSKMKEFCVVQAPAKKVEGRGRPSGGLITAFNENKYKKTKEKISDDYLIINIKNIEKK